MKVHVLKWYYPTLEAYGITQLDRMTVMLFSLKLKAPLLSSPVDL